MLSEEARVVAVENDGLWVETHKQSACAQCRAQHGCGQKLLAGVHSDMTLVKALFIDTSPNEIWKVGDKALIGVEEQALVTGALIAYMVPLLGLVAGVLLADQAGLTDGLVALAGFAGLLLGGVAVRFHSRHLTRNISAGKPSCYQAVVLGKPDTSSPRVV